MQWLTRSASKNVTHPNMPVLAEGEASTMRANWGPPCATRCTAVTRAFGEATERLTINDSTVPGQPYARQWP
eukprot:238599-Prymnesium_polylepis.1